MRVKGIKRLSRRDISCVDCYRKQSLVKYLDISMLCAVVLDQLRQVVDSQ